MAIKTKTSRDTYRSNVKKRPLRQNGLEAQYQGLDISEVNIDHAGLQIIGRGGYQTRRDIRKVRKQYIVDVPQEEHYPTAELVLLSGSSGDPFNVSSWNDGTDSNPVVSIQGMNNESFQLEDSAGNAFNFVFTNDPAHINGELIPATSNIAVNIYENNFSKRDLMFAITGSIEAVFPQDTFRFELYPSGSNQKQIGIQEPVKIVEDKIVLFLSASVPASAALTATSVFLDDSNNFDDQSQSHEWRLNGYLKDLSNPGIFFEDLRTDTMQSVAVHSNRAPKMLFRSAQFDPSAPSENYKNFYDKEINNIAGDPTTTVRFATHDSEEILIRQYPKREELFDTYRGNHQWREDVHYLAQDQQVWSRMQDMALTYHSSLEDHIGAMMDSNFADEQYIDPNPLSGRIDVFNRLSRIFDMSIDLIYERHQHSLFDQYLEPVVSMQNLETNRFPKSHVDNRDLAYEENQGVRHDNKVMWNDYYDQEPLDHYDHIEDERWTRIDESMLEVLTRNDPHENRSIIINRREWQETDYVYTSTGFINSQTSGQDGIIYREMKR